MAAAPFSIIPSLAAIAVGYPQGKLVADFVLPRVPVMTQTFRYLKYAQGDQFQMPDTTVGRKGAPNQIDWSSSELTAAVVDQALDAPVPNVDVLAWQQAHAAGPGYVSAASPEERAAMLVMQAVMNRREYRAANLVFNANSYGAANKITLSGTGQWSDFTNADPVTAILTAFDAMIVRPNYGVVGQLTATKLRTHPKIVNAIRGNVTGAGVVPLKAVADLLELDEIYVGGAFVNTAAPGQATVTARAWGKHASFFYRDMNADMSGGITFGMTGMWGDRFGGEVLDGDIGARGGKRIRAGESVIELITANDLGYFFQNAVL